MRRPQTAVFRDLSSSPNSTSGPESRHSVETELDRDIGIAVDAIVERTGDHDLTVVGATCEGPLQQLVFGAVPEAVGERAETAVITAKRPPRLTSWFRRWFRWE